MPWIRIQSQVFDDPIIPTHPATDCKNAETSVADPDPGSGAFLTSGSGMGKQSKSGSGMNIPHHISESLETIFWVKILQFFYADPEQGSGPFDPGYGMEKFGSGDKDPGSATLAETLGLLFNNMVLIGLHYDLETE